VAAQKRPAKRHIFAACCRKLEEWAPDAAVSYRLAIRRAGEAELHYFPVGGFFDLDPMEPPQVPMVGSYLVRYYDRYGAALETPRALLEGLFVEPADPTVKFPTSNG
jgi:hypothetical protein